LTYNRTPPPERTPMKTLLINAAIIALAVVVAIKAERRLPG
jgi:hypothetical protein